MENIILALIESAELDYTGKELQISSERFSSLMMAYSVDMVKDRIAHLQRKKATEKEERKNAQ